MCSFADALGYVFASFKIHFRIVVQLHHVDGRYTGRTVIGAAHLLPRLWMERLLLRICIRRSGFLCAHWRHRGAAPPAGWGFPAPPRAQRVRYAPAFPASKPARRASLPAALVPASALSSVFAGVFGSAGCTGSLGSMGCTGSIGLVSSICGGTAYPPTAGNSNVSPSTGQIRGSSPPFPRPCAARAGQSCPSPGIQTSRPPPGSHPRWAASASLAPKPVLPALPSRFLLAPVPPFSPAPPLSLPRAV